MKSNYTILFLLIVLFTGCVRDEKEKPEGADIAVGDQIPAFGLSLDNGIAVNSQLLNGKVSLILFFSTTCPDCRQLLPIADKFYNDYKDNKDFVMFAVSREQSGETISRYWQANNFTIPYSAQDTKYIYSLFAKAVIPRIYIADKDRVVTAIFTDNPIATYEDLKNEIDVLLK